VDKGSPERVDDVVNDDGASISRITLTE
jgi:hypothetical protein